MHSFRLDSASKWRAIVVGWFVFWGAAFGGSVVPAEAQVEPGSAANALTSAERPIRVTIQPAYQRFDDSGRTLTQWSAPLEMVIPFRERWQVSIRGSVASAGGNSLHTVSGLTDVRAAVSYAQPVGQGSVIINANVNAPTGKEELSQEEFITATLLSQNFYRFRVASFGQGWGAGTGITWALPVTESVVLGIGGAFQYRGSYDPVAALQQEYDPAEEGRFTAGIDVQLTRMSALSADVSLFVYGTDTVGDVDQFNAGNHASVRVQYLRRADERTVRVVGQYRQQENSTLPVRAGSNQERQVLPSHGMLRGRYSAPLSETLGLRVSAAGRWYGDTFAFDRKTVVTFRGGLEFEVGEGFEVSPGAGFTTGSFTGLEGSLRLTALL
jgi:hypothetical protein